MVGNDRLRYAQAPLQDWRATAEAALARLAHQAIPLYHLAHAGPFPDWTDRAYNHYLAGRAVSQPLPLDAVATAEGPFLIVFGHMRCGPTGENRLMARLRSEGVEFEGFLPPQTMPCANGYLLVHPPRDAGQP